jgi:hypothetical protein
MHPSHVQILMCTWNGAPHLAAQFRSFLDQDHADWSLWVRDDGSTDATLSLLHSFRAAHPDRQITIAAGAAEARGNQTPDQALGSAGNFLTLLADPRRPAGTVAFADQDDVWLPHKLSRALAVLGPDPGPAVYASRTIHTDAALLPRGLSTLHPGPPGFRNALVQNVLGGNTIVMNPAATALLRSTCPAALAGPGVPFHDWWVYLVATGAGARVTNDAEPGLFYRQHGRNVLGAHQGLRGGLARLGSVRAGEWSGWIDRNLAALSAVAAHLTPENRALLAAFADLRSTPGPLARCRSLSRLGIRRQTGAGNLMLAALALAGRL